MTPHQNIPEHLPPAAADCATVVRLKKIREEEKSSIINRPARSTYPKKKSVSTSGATSGFQSIAQVRGTNGDANAQTIVENCGNTVILRCSASERGGTARFASELIGQRDVIRTVTSKSKVNKHWFPDEANSEHHATEFAVLPSEIEQLPDLVGYLRLASSASWQVVRIQRP